MSDKRVQYVPGYVPASGNQALDDFLRREFQAIYLSLQNVWDMQVSTSPPERLYEGMLRFADGTEWNPGAGRGVYEYRSGAWNKL